MRSRQPAVGSRQETEATGAWAVALLPTADHQLPTGRVVA